MPKYGVPGAARVLRRRDHAARAAGAEAARHQDAVHAAEQLVDVALLQVLRFHPAPD